MMMMQRSTILAHSKIHALKVTHVAIVDVEDMNLCRWLNFLHPGSVPAAAKE